MAFLFIFQPQPNLNMCQKHITIFEHLIPIHYYTFSLLFSRTRLKYNNAPKVLRNIKISDQMSFSCCPGRGKLLSGLCKQSISIDNQKMMAIAMIPINPRSRWNTKGTTIKTRIPKIIHPIIHLDTF